MNKVLNYGVYLGIVTFLSACGTSEHFMQDDVYNTRTPIMPPGTDLNDVTDYATFVAKKEQTETQERTTYVSPRQYNDYFYNSQYVFYGYSPYSSLSGLGYYGYGSYYHPNGFGYGSNLYPSIGFGSYYGSGYGPYSYPYGYYGGYGQPYYPYYGSNSWYTPSNKPNTGSNLSNSHAGTSAGRMGSSTSGIVSYPHQITAKPNTHGYAGTGRNSTINSSPVVHNSSGRNTNLNGREMTRPVSTGRSSAPAPRSGSYQRTNEPAINSGTNNRSNNNTNNNSNTRTSSPTIRSGGSSGGSISTPSSGGSRSGGRR